MFLIKIFKNKIPRNIFFFWNLYEINIKVLFVFETNNVGVMTN